MRISSDLATLFTGKTYSVEVYLFSYKEFLEYYKLENSQDNYDRYVLEGGFSGFYLYKDLDKRYNYISDIVYRNKICPTITAGGSDIWIENWGAKINQNEIINAQTFPQDYNYCGQKPKYICGMSVPPIMIKRLMTRLIESGLYNYKLNR